MGSTLHVDPSSCLQQQQQHGTINQTRGMEKISNIDIPRTDHDLKPSSPNLEQRTSSTIPPTTEQRIVISRNSRSCLDQSSTMSEIQSNDPVVIQDIVVDPLLSRDRSLLLRNPSSFMGDMNFPVYPFLRHPSSSFSAEYNHPIYRQVPSFEELTLLKEGSVDYYMPIPGQGTPAGSLTVPYLPFDAQNAVTFDSPMLEIQRKRSSSMQTNSGIPKFVRQNTDMQYPSQSNQSNQSNQSKELKETLSPSENHSGERLQIVQGIETSNHLEFGENPIPINQSQFSVQHSSNESTIAEREKEKGHMFITANVNGVDYQSEM